MQPGKGIISFQCVRKNYDSQLRLERPTSSSASNRSEAFGPDSTYLHLVPDQLKLSRVYIQEIEEIFTLVP